MKRPLPFIISLTLLGCTLSANARRLKSPGKLKRQAETEQVVRFDTIFPRPGAVIFSGYEKTNASTKESFFVTNTCGGDTLLTAVEVTLTYLDMEGQMLHKRTETVKCLIPAGETRALTLPSWDTNHAFHYFRSKTPVRKQSTPFRVSSQVQRIVISQ